MGPALRDSTAYRYDLVDVARQVLANRGRVLLPKIRTDYRNKDFAAFRRHTATWTGQLAMMDRLLGADDSFLLGVWQHEASTWAPTTPRTASSSTTSASS